MEKNEEEQVECGRNEGEKERATRTKLKLKREKKELINLSELPNSGEFAEKR